MEGEGPNFIIRIEERFFKGGCVDPLSPIEVFLIIAHFQYGWILFL